MGGLADGGFKDATRNQVGRGQTSIVLAGYFHLEGFIGRREVIGPGVSQEGYHPFLECAKAALYFPLGLGGWSHEVGHPQGSQGALEFASWIAVVMG